VNDQQAAAPPATSPPAGGRRKLYVVGALGLVVLGGSVAAWWLGPRLVGSRGADAAPAAVARKQTPVRATVSLGPVVVNLAGEARRYVRAGVAVGVAGPGDVKEIEAARAQLTDLVIAVLAGTDADRLLAADGRRELKDELLERMHRELRLEKAVGVYFTEFVVQ
jgi:flagellar basal body-associated protein FliL